MLTFHPYPHTRGVITPTQHDKDEWSRMAQAAYQSGHNNIGNRYNRAANIPQNYRITLRQFDELQDGYRAWLCFNEWPTNAGDAQ